MASTAQDEERFIVGPLDPYPVLVEKLCERVRPWKRIAILPLGLGRLSEK
jgi:hypothetical protein